MPTDHEIHEDAFIKVFIAPDKKERYLSMRKTKFGRKKLLHRLNHITMHELDLNRVRKISAEEHTALKIKELLVSKGASNSCFCLSGNPTIDGLEVPLIDALSSTIGMGIGTVISCLPDQLAYFEGEEKGAWFLCEHKLR